jgi:transposase
MNEWTTIRRRVLVEKASKRSVCLEFGIGWGTLQKILTHATPPGYQRSSAKRKPKIGAFLGVIEEILEADKTAPIKQRHTAKRIFERLRDEHGYEGGITQVTEIVAQARLHGKEVFVPLSHPPGHAQFDFGEAQVVIAGERVKAALSVMTLPYSDVFHVSAYPRECTESFQAGHVAGFAFFGGVPLRTSYDNSKIAVNKVIGRERDLTTEFLRLESHFLFAHHFCSVARGNEKGHVEGLVGFGRRNFLVPVPSFGSFAELNIHLEAACTADMDRSVRGKPEGKGERLEQDRAAMLEIPAEPFEIRRVEQRHANSLSLVRFDRNDYSVPTANAHHQVTAFGSIDDVRLAVGTEVVATHPRCWSKEQVFFDPRHYLALLERKPGALDFARPLENWGLPGCFSTLRRRLEGDLGHVGTREYIKVLRLMEKATVKELASAIEVALSIGATAADAITLILFHRQERPVELFSLDGHPHLKSVAVDDLDLGAYDTLTETCA